MHALVLAGVAYAASAVAQGNVAPSPSTSSSPQPTNDLSLQREVDLTPAEMLERASLIVSRIEQAGAGIRRALETARTNKDVVKTLCLNDKLNEVDTATRSARSHRDQLATAVATSNADNAQHEFSLLSVFKARVDQVQADANLCIGSEASVIGNNAVVTSTIEGTLPPSDDTYYPPTDTTLISAPAQCDTCEE